MKKKGWKRFNLQLFQNVDHFYHFPTIFHKCPAQFLPVSCVRVISRSDKCPHIDAVAFKNREANGDPKDFQCSLGDLKKP